MPLSWNEIRLQALNFAEEWKDKAQLAKEEADAQDFQTGKKGIRERGTVNRVQVRSFRHNQIKRNGTWCEKMFVEIYLKI